MEMPPLRPSTPAVKAVSELALTSIGKTHTPDGSPANDEPQKPATGVHIDWTGTSHTKTVRQLRSRRNSAAESVDELSLVEPAVIKICRSKSSPAKTSIYPRNLDSAISVSKEQSDTDTIAPPKSVKPDVHVLGPQTHEPVLEVPQDLKRSKREISEGPSETDELLSSVPRENYKPRPSRSRSTQLVQEYPIDYSGRPQQAMRGKGKRRKTTHDDSNSNTPVSTSEKIEAINNMGFSSTEARLALKASLGNIEQAIDQLVSQPDPELLQKEQSLPRSKSRFVGVEVSPVRLDFQAVGDHYSQEDTDASSKYQVEELDKHEEPGVSPTAPIEPAKDGIETGLSAEPVLSSIQAEVAGETLECDEVPILTKPRPKHRKASKNQNMEEDDSQVEGQPIERPPEKKRGRGRPRKNVGATAILLPVDDSTEPLETLQVVDEQEGRQVSSPLKDVAPNSRALVAKIDSCVGDADVIPPTKLREDKTPVSTPENKKDLKSAVEHSPLDKGKVPYRVGLSKRARIAPLLKTMKK
jgi:hypothetical protein